MVSWLNSLLSGVAAGLLFFGFIIIFKNYMRHRYHPSLYMSIAWFGFMLEAMFTSMMYGFESGSSTYQIFQKLDNLSLIPAFLGMIAFLESLTRDGIEPKSFTLLIFLLGTDSILVFFQSNVSLGSAPWMIVITIGLIISIASIIFYMKLYRHVPVNLKRSAMLTVIGQFFVSLLFVILNIINGIFHNVIGSVDRVFEGIGALIQAIIFAKYEQLFYVLPFKTQRLIVFGTKNGASLFAHTWSKNDKLLDEDLLSGVLHGVSMLFSESLNKGNLQEIKMEQGILLIKHDKTHCIAFVIIASRSSAVLRDGLAGFANKFIETYASCLEPIESYEKFQDATSIVQSCLNFIPQYD
jgi:hypothetical protein